MKTPSEELAELREEIERLKARIALLESPTDFIWWPVSGPKPSCSACGLVIEGTMGYVCNRQPCPVGLGGATC